MQTGKTAEALPENLINSFLRDIFAEKRRKHACSAKNAGEFIAWKSEALKEFIKLLKIKSIEENCLNHEVKVSLSEPENMGEYNRYKGFIETEPGVMIGFWMLKPHLRNKLPLAVTPHGHENTDTYVGIWQNDHERKKIEQEDQAVALEAVKRGFLVIVPCTRGIYTGKDSFAIRDVKGIYGSDCKCHNWQALAAGRTTIGERVWDLTKILDWAIQLPEVDPNSVLMTGNSGGGMATLYTAAYDERIKVAAPCCSFNSLILPGGLIRHCTCNAIPGIMEFGELWDVAGLIAPRYLFTVNGSEDSMHPAEEVSNAAQRLSNIYSVAGAPENYKHSFGPGGHRFFKDIMWPLITKAMNKK